MRLSSLCRQGWVKMRKDLFSGYLVKYILYYPPAPFWGSSGAGRRRHWNGVTMAYLLHFSVPPYRKEENIKELESFTDKKSSPQAPEQIADTTYSPRNQSQVPIVFVKWH